jgi:hypothetical protein
MGLLSLTNSHRRDQIEQACQIAQSHGAYHLRSLRQLIEQQNPPAIQQSFDFLQQHPIIRDLGDYEQFVRQAIADQSSQRQALAQGNPPLPPQESTA